MRHLQIISMVLAQSAVLFAQTPDKSCCEVKILPAPESPAELTITIKNVNVPLVDVVITRSEGDFKVIVKSNSGKEVRRTEYGRRLLNEGYDTSSRHRGLKTGEDFTQKLDLRAIFELEPGTYNVALTRDVFVGKTRVQLEATAKISIP